MAFTHQTCSSIADMFTKIEAFLSGQGWSTHLATGSGEFAAWKNPSGSIWVTMACQWDTSTPRHVGVFQWHGQAYDTGGSTGTVPYDQDDDSGNGSASTSDSTLDDARHVDLGAGGPTEFWVFEDTNYFHIVAKHTTNRYMHFGSGYLTKFNDWTGGEYCYGQTVDETYNSDTAVRIAASYLLDGLSQRQSPGIFTGLENHCATLHIEGMDEQTTEKWAVCMGNQPSANLGTARNSDARIHVSGGYRSGMFPPLLGQFAGTLGRGLVPLYPIIPFYWNRTNGDVYGPLGQMPDVRGVSIKNFSAEDEITIGSDTWVVFPSFRKTTGSTTGGTNNQGIAYKQVA